MRQGLRTEFKRKVGWWNPLEREGLEEEEEEAGPLEEKGGEEEKQEGKEEKND